MLISKSTDEQAVGKNLAVVVPYDFIASASLYVFESALRFSALPDTPLYRRSAFLEAFRRASPAGASKAMSTEPYRPTAARDRCPKTPKRSS